MQPVIRGSLTFLAFLVFSQAVLSGVALSAEVSAQKFPDIVNVKVQARGADKFDFDVTVSSPYDTAQRYADAFRVTDQHGTVLGVRQLVHDHASEQPFTRDLYGVSIPGNVRIVAVQARDQRYGYGGKSVEVVLPGR